MTEGTRNLKQWIMNEISIVDDATNHLRGMGVRRN